ncbi:uncharacterized protein plekho2 [Xenentodon cancila]
MTPSSSYPDTSGTKEDPTQHKGPKFLGKAGWVKKAYGRLLASYKDRFICVEKTEIVVYENEDLQNCMERLDLENYDKCHELKSPFKKKHRLILIRSSKSGNKVHDVKFQAQNTDEKDAWIKALSDGINRAKNKVFDEVKIDEASNLEHVTRTRPKGNRNRRPPTRIHMKEVAVVSSDGILRLDLDLEDAVMPNGTHSSADGTEASKKATDPTPQPNASEDKEKQLQLSAEEKDEQDASPQKVIKPPMPPTKEAKPTLAAKNEPDKDDGLQKKVLKPPMPPSKEAKPCAMPTEDDAEDQNPDKKKTGPPPTPSIKPASGGSLCNLVEASQTTPSSYPPTPPSKEKKPSHLPVEPEKRVQGMAEDDEAKEEDKTDASVKPDEMDELISEEGLGCVGDDKPRSLGIKGSVSDDEELETVICGMNKASDNGTQTEPQSISVTSKISVEKPLQPLVQHEDHSPISQPNEGGGSAASDTSGTFPQALEALRPNEVPSAVVSLSNPLTDSVSLSPLLCHLSKQKTKKAEEKSVDSGQHSNDDSDGSGSEDTLAASTAVLRGSHADLDVLDAHTDDIQISVHLRPAARPQVRPKVFSCRRSEPSQKPLKPSTKARSASSGDLLSDSSGSIQLTQPGRAENIRAPLPNDNIKKLETEVALEMENTDELLRKARGETSQEGVPEDLLAKAMEKLRKADHFLREVKKLKLSTNSSNRMSW